MEVSGTSTPACAGRPEHLNTSTLPSMRFLIQFIAIIVFAYILQLFLPWYYVAVASFVMGFLLKSKYNFLAGFLAIALLWFVMAWIIDSSATTDLTERVAAIFTLPKKGWLFLMTSIIGGLIGGFSALTGGLLKRKTKTFNN